MSTSFLVSFIGFLLLFMFGKRTSAFFVTTLCAIFLFFARWLSFSPLLCWFLICGLAIFLAMIPEKRARSAPFTLERQRDLIDDIILFMKSGQSLRWSLVKVSQERGPEGEIAEIILKHLHAANAYEGSDRGLREFIERLAKVEANPAKKLEVLENWRFELRIKQEFRQKSRQASTQARVQSIFCGLLLAPAVIWNFVMEGNASWSRVAIALTLFAVAFLCMNQVVRGFRWKV